MVDLQLGLVAWLVAAAHEVPPRARGLRDPRAQRLEPSGRVGVQRRVRPHVPGGRAARIRALRIAGRRPVAALRCRQLPLHRRVGSAAATAVGGARRGTGPVRRVHRRAVAARCSCRRLRHVLSAARSRTRAARIPPGGRGDPRASGSRSIGGRCGRASAASTYDGRAAAPRDQAMASRRRPSGSVRATSSSSPALTWRASTRATAATA